MTALLLVHALAAVCAPVLARVMGRQAFLVMALVPGAGFAWAVTRLPGVLAGSELVETVPWVPSLDLAVVLRLDALALTFAALVTGVGALVLVYCARYVEPGDPGAGRLAGYLTAFAGSMLGLVLADDVFLLYVFWELTTVFSWLLIGGTGRELAGRRAAGQALLLTTAGGLAMLVGLVVLAASAGSSRLSQIVAEPGSGPMVVVGTLLVLAGALTKSAMVPFHFWLPSAMQAPTPVSAYLHAAAMVKAGVYLVARLAPGYADVPGWRPVVLGLGAASMLVGGYRALRQHDLKLLLAYGTISQLGFLMTLVGGGSAELGRAGLAMVLAHGLFKSTLFLTVGIVEHATGTRDLRELSGVGRRLRVIAAAAGLAAASMAGLPPLLGFVGKEAAFTALWDGGLPDRTSAVALLVALVAGSVLTVAYTARFLWGAFATKETSEDATLDRTGATPVEHPPEGLFLAAPVVLGSAGLLAGLAAPALDALVEGYAATLPLLAPEEEHLALWHGLQPALGLSVVTLAGGLVLFAVRARVALAQRRVAMPYAADAGYWNTLQALDRFAVLVTGSTQRGSLPVYLGVILAVVLLFPGGLLLFRGNWPGDWRAWDAPVQAVVAAAVLAAAAMAVRIRQRLSAAVVVGITGYGSAVLFVVHGAPDLALTQVLVETVTLVAVVLVLRKLPLDVGGREPSRDRVGRGVLAAGAGVFMAIAAAVALDSRTAPPVSEAYPELAYEEGHGRNVVNVTLVDIRAWDTFGELSVLVVAATGVASLVFLRGRIGAPARADLPGPGDDGTSGPGGPRSRWLAAGSTVDPRRRSLVLEVVTRLLFHAVVVFSLFLLFAGHNQPGGGFAGGLVAGLALVLRYLAGGRYELAEAAPVDPGRLMGLGLLLAGGTAAAGFLLGGQVLESGYLDVTVPVLGDVALVSALVFDVGVYLIVVGLVLDVLRSLGAELDRQEEEDEEADEAADPAREVVIR